MRGECRGGVPGSLVVVTLFTNQAEDNTTVARVVKNAVNLGEKIRI